MVSVFVPGSAKTSANATDPKCGMSQNVTVQLGTQANPSESFRQGNKALPHYWRKVLSRISPPFVISFFKSAKVSQSDKPYAGEALLVPDVHRRRRFS